MDNIKIRNATTTESDINGITHVHREGEDAWDNIRECEAWISKRLERGFYIRLAEIDGKIVGHAEWIISDEPNRKFLYLGMLQIDEDYQRKGIGRVMIADGIEYAKVTDCIEVVTSPDMDNRADIFYRKCGFTDARKHYSSYVKTQKYKDYEFEKTIIDKVPFSAIAEKRYIFGKGQFCSRHMWEVMNEKPSTDNKRRTPAVLLPDGTYIQLHIWKEEDNGGVYIWSNSTNYENIIKSALSFGYSLGLNSLFFGYLEDEENFLDGFDVYDKKQEDDFEQVYYINQEELI